MNNMQQQGFLNIANASDAEILSMIDGANKKGLSIYLNKPATVENINGILSNISCRRCGLCCSTGTCPGVKENGIPLDDIEILKIANYLHIRTRKVKKLCFVNDLGRYSLPYPCPFYEDSHSPKCSIYSVRPTTCRAFPIYSIENNNIAIDSGCPEAKDFTLKHYQSMRDSLQKHI